MYFLFKKIIIIILFNLISNLIFAKNEEEVKFYGHLKVKQNNLIVKQSDWSIESSIYDCKKNKQVNNAIKRKQNRKNARFQNIAFTRNKKQKQFNKLNKFKNNLFYEKSPTKTWYDEKYKIKKNKFDFLYNIYDRLIYISHNFPHKKANKLIRDICTEYKLKSKYIVDIGSFTGYYSFYFSAERNKVIAIELSNKIELARERYKNYPIVFLNGDTNNILSNFKNNSVDFIFCSSFPGHYDTKNFATSTYMENFYKIAYSKIDRNGVIYYLFYSTKHKKVTYPVTKNDIFQFIEKLQISNYTLNERTDIYDFPVIEFIVKK